MIDKVKRNTLKRIGMSAVVATTAGVATSSLAAKSFPSIANQGTESQQLADIQISTRVSATNNDLELLITNSGKQHTKIKQITPLVTSTKRGHFDFRQLMKDGDLALAPGQSVRVPMQRHAVQVGGTETSNQHSLSLTDALRRSFSVLTADDSYAKVSVVDGIRFV